MRSGRTSAEARRRGESGNRRQGFTRRGFSNKLITLGIWHLTYNLTSAIIMVALASAINLPVFTSAGRLFFYGFTSSNWGIAFAVPPLPSNFACKGRGYVANGIMPCWFRKSNREATRCLYASKSIWGWGILWLRRLA